MIEHLSIAKTEAGEKIQQATNAVLFIAIGGVVVMVALIVLLFAVVAFLVAAGLAVEWSALIAWGVVALSSQQ